MEAALAASERDGLRVVLLIRNVVVALMMLFIAVTQGLETGWFGVSVLSVFLVAGLIYHALVVRALDRHWMRFAFTALDMGLLALVAVVVPLSIEGDVPQIFVFRVYGAVIFFFLLATSALSLSPRLVLWTGAMAVLALWSAWGWIVWQMDRVVTWSAIANDRTARKYIEIVLDPDHVGLANRATETILLLATAAVTAAAVARARNLIRSQLEAERARSHMTEVFGRFVPAEVTEALTDADGNLPATARTATVMFVDIEGFTPFAERSSPDHIVAVLDAFFETVSDIAGRHRGVCISLIGDAALVAFNAPLANDEHARAALDAVDDLLAEVARRDFAGETLAIRVGLATGPVSAGTVGGRGRRAYTLYGDTVNLAQRLEALNKDLGTTVLIDDATWRNAGLPPSYSPARPTTVKGRETPVEIHARAG